MSYCMLRRGCDHAGTDGRRAEARLQAYATNRRRQWRQPPGSRQATTVHGAHPYIWANRCLERRAVLVAYTDTYNIHCLSVERIGRLTCARDRCLIHAVGDLRPSHGVL